MNNKETNHTSNTLNNNKATISLYLGDLASSSLADCGDDDDDNNNNNNNSNNNNDNNDDYNEAMPI